MGLLTRLVAWWHRHHHPDEPEPSRPGHDDQFGQWLHQRKRTA